MLSQTIITQTEPNIMGKVADKIARRRIMQRSTVALKKAAADNLDITKPIEGDTSWDSLIDLQKQIEALLLLYVDIPLMFGDKDLMSYVTDREAVNANVRSMTKDLLQLKPEFDAIKNHHTGRTGGATDYDDFMKASNIFEAYNLFAGRFHSTVAASGNHLLEVHETATKLRQLSASGQVVVATATPAPRGQASSISHVDESAFQAAPPTTPAA